MVRNPYKLTRRELANAAQPDPTETRGVHPDKHLTALPTYDTMIPSATGSEESVFIMFFCRKMPLPSALVIGVFSVLLLPCIAHALPATLQAKGEEEAQIGNWLLASRYFGEALAEAPDNIVLHLLAARTALELGRQEKAEEFLRDVLNRSPKAVLFLARMKAQQEAWQAVANLIIRYNRSRPRDPEALMLQALAFFHNEKYGKALKAALTAGNLDTHYKGQALLLAAQAKFRLADMGKARKALRMAAPLISGTSEEVLASDLAALIASKGEQKKRWWAYAFLDSVYTDNKLFLSDLTRWRFGRRDDAGYRLNNRRVLAGMVGYLRANVAWQALLDPVQVTTGYAGTQEVYGQEKATYRTDFGNQTIRADAASVHTFWAEVARYTPLEDFSLEPALETSLDLDMPGLSPSLISVNLIPKTTFYMDNFRSMTSAFELKINRDLSGAKRNSLDESLELQFQYTGRSRWHYGRATFTIGNHDAEQAGYSYRRQRLRFDSRLMPWKGLLVELLADVEQRYFRDSSEDRIDSLLSGDMRLGWMFWKRRIVASLTASQTHQLSTVSAFKARVRLYGVRLGGLF